MLSVSNISLEDQTLILINCLIIIPSYFLIISPKYRGEIKINQFYFPSDVQQCQAVSGATTIRLCISKYS